MYDTLHVPFILIRIVTMIFIINTSEVLIECIAHVPYIRAYMAEQVDCVCLHGLLRMYNGPCLLPEIVHKSVILVQTFQ